MRLALLALGVTACGTPAPQLLLGLAGPPTQACPSTDCEKVPLPCDAVMSIRIVDPSNPGHEYLKQCTKVPPDIGYDTCSLRSVDLDQAPIPVREVEVQVAVFPLSDLPRNGSGDPVCPSDIQYSADGFPVEQAPSPALGGHAYYHPGDSSVKVTLGCTNISPLHAGASCGGSATGSTTATVDDFDTRLSVTGGATGVANDLWVSVGEPHILDGNDVLTPLDTVALRLQGGDPPTWSAGVSPKFSRFACVEVLEDVPETTASLRCVPATRQATGQAPDLKGMWISTSTLNGILRSLPTSGGRVEFPKAGITIGIVLDPLFNGAAGYTISPQVTYWSPTAGMGGSATSSNGVFVSMDQPFGTVFSATGPSATVPAIGGRVAGKVTLVVLPVADRRRDPPADPAGVVIPGR
ncbi:MAG TPA: hypothetical protein VF469_00875 [Kofleriaceae bacterium]